jgi:hypothetical protein
MMGDGTLAGSCVAMHTGMGRGLHAVCRLRAPNVTGVEAAA